MPPKTDTNFITNVTSQEQWDGHCTVGCIPKQLKGWLIVVEVYASWCGPCGALKLPLNRLYMDKIVGEKRKLKFLRVDAAVMGNAGQPLEAYTLGSKPTLMLFKDGEQVEIVEGVNIPELSKQVETHMPEGKQEDDALGEDEAEDEDM